MAAKQCVRCLRSIAGTGNSRGSIFNGPSHIAHHSQARSPVSAFDNKFQGRAYSTDTSLASAGTSLPIIEQSMVPKLTTTLPASLITTVYRFPDMEPLEFASYSATHLGMPLRKDLLHKAIVFEGDMARSGTASTKWRLEVHGSGRKLAPQKGLGRARVGDKKSPIRRGGGVAFGPKPRDFSTELPRKMYDQAWRTALSYRYRRGELIVVDQIRNLSERWPSFIKEVFAKNQWGQSDKRSLLVAEARNDANNLLFGGMKVASKQGRLLELWDVDVKDLLSLGRVVIERHALDKMLAQHSSDIRSPTYQMSDTPGTL